MGGVRIRVDTEYADGRTLTMAYDGKVGWREVSDLGFGLLSPADAFWVFLAHHPTQLSVLHSRFVSSSPLPQEIHDGVPSDVFLVTDTDGQHSRWLFDPSTGHLTGIEGAAPNGTLLRFSDFRKVGPLTLPFDFQMFVGTKRIYALRRRSLSLNVPLTGEFFSPMTWDVGDAEKAQAILGRYLKTCASSDVLGRIHSRIVRSTVDSPSTGVTSDRAITVVYPNKILIDTETKGIGQTLAGYDGTTGGHSASFKASISSRPRKSRVSSRAFQAWAIRRSKTRPPCGALSAPASFRVGSRPPSPSPACGRAWAFSISTTRTGDCCGSRRKSGVSPETSRWRRSISPISGASMARISPSR